MTSFFIGIAGGSGCGKSTLAYGLRDAYPDSIEVVHFDDYQKEEYDVPFFEGMRNWDHPDAINFEKLYVDLLQLKNNNEVEVMTKSSILNPTYEEKGRIQHILKPKKIILVEGYLTFHEKRIRDLFDLKIFLDIPISESMKRRNKITYTDESAYNAKILFPMHRTFVESTKQLAGLSIDVVKNTKEEVYKIVCDTLIDRKLLPKINIS
jgi:uridine kinase